MTGMIIFDKKYIGKDHCAECDKDKRYVYLINSSDIGFNINYEFYCCIKCYIKAKFRAIFKKDGDYYD